MSDEFKKEYKKADLNLEGTSKDDERSPVEQSGRSSPVIDFMLFAYNLT